MALQAALLTITYTILSRVFSRHFSIAYSPCVLIYMSETLSQSRDPLMLRVQWSTQVSNDERGEEERVGNWGAESSPLCTSLLENKGLAERCPILS